MAGLAPPRRSSDRFFGFLEPRERYQQKHVFLPWAKMDQKAVTIASWPPKARFLVDFHPPHPPGAGRVKLHGYHLEPNLNQPTPSLNPSPAGPEIRPRAHRRRLLDLASADPFGTLFSHRFQDPFFPVFFKMLTISGSHLGSILAPFSFNSAYLFRTLFLHAFFIDLYRFLEP